MSKNINKLGKSLRLLLVAPPGGGKGTVINKLINNNTSYIKDKTKNLNIISSGNILRNYKDSKDLKKYITSGALVPDNVITTLILKEIEKLDLTIKDKENKITIFDGFPRTLTQFYFTKDNVSKDKYINMIIEMAVPHELIIDRCCSRYIHLKSGRTYNLKYNPPKKEGLDDVTGEPLIQRDDDKVETVTKRLEDYKEKLQEMREFIDNECKEGVLEYHKVDGETSDINYAKIDQILTNYFEK